MKYQNVLAVAAAWMALAGAAAAQQTPVNPSPAGRAMRQACAADAKTFCADVTPGGGRLMQCMRANADKLSQGCKDAVAQMRAAHQAAHEGAQPGQPAPQ